MGLGKGVCVQRGKGTWGLRERGAPPFRRGLGGVEKAPKSKVKSLRASAAFSWPSQGPSLTLRPKMAGMKTPNGGQPQGLGPPPLKQRLCPHSLMGPPVLWGLFLFPIMLSDASGPYQPAPGLGALNTFPQS